MPIYDYKCKDCDSTSDIVINSPDYRMVHCTECEGQDINKPVFALHFIKTDESVPDATCYWQQNYYDLPSCSSGNNCQRR